jgi:putative membrane protein
MRTHTSLLSIALAVILLGAASQVSAGDRAFVAAALKSGTAEVQRASVMVNSTDSRVVALAAKMRTDHQEANQQLSAIASTKGIDTEGAIPQPPQHTTPAPNGGRVNVPQSNPAPMKPAAYFKTEVQAHQQAIALFKKEASSGTDPQIRAFAKKTLPILEQHLKMAQNDLKAEH